MKSFWPQKASLTGEMKHFIHEHEKLSENDDLLIYDQHLVIPSTSQRKVLSALHAGHTGSTQMTELYSDAYWWPGMEFIKEFTKSCLDCSCTGKSAKTVIPPTTLIQHPSEPWKKVAIDITGPFSTAPKHQCHVVVLVDYYSAFPELLFTDEVTSKKIMEWLTDIFARFRKQTKWSVTMGHNLHPTSSSSFCLKYQSST